MKALNIMNVIIRWYRIVGQEETRLVPRRSILYVPASSEKMLAKVHQIKVVAIFLMIKIFFSQ